MRFLGHIISYLRLDPRDGRTLLAAAKTGHLGPTIFRSTDLGGSWKEAALAAPKVSVRSTPARTRRRILARLRLRAGVEQTKN